MQEETGTEKGMNGKPRSMGQIWDDLRRELKEGRGDRKEFSSIPKVDVPAVLELKRRGYISICQLKIKIEEKYRGKEV